jgi:C4-dicarboxylate transporter, DctM subunit
MLSGIATAVESSAIGAVAAFLVALFSGRLRWASMNNLIMELVRTCGFIFFIIAGVSLFSWVLSFYLIPQSVVKFVIATGLPPLMVIFLMQLMYIVMGMFLNPNSMIFITVPVVYPVIVALGFDPVWFGVLLLVNIEMAVVTPPVAMALYIVHSLSPKGVSLSDVVKGTVPFVLGGDLVVLMLIFFFPQLALWLPNLMK